MLEKKFDLAEQTYRDDLKFYPRNGWSMFGLVASLEAQSKTDEAKIIERKAKDVWQLADAELMPVIY
jgi:hypothetical protein